MLRLRPEAEGRSARALWWTVAAVPAAVAVALALTSPTKAPRGHLTPEQAHDAFRTIAGAEPQLRREAAKRFPTDPWSQDDDFHRQEMTRARSFADSHRAPLGEVLRAVDDGMREGWPRPGGAEVRVTVPPCRPRAIY